METTAKKNIMPVLFVGHGNPMNALEDNEFVREWIKVGKTIEKPKAVLCISAHWETMGPRVTTASHPKTIHDFGGFPADLYEVQYPSPGSPELANELVDVLKDFKLTADENRGLDHGAWTVIRHFYPHADVPVIQLSLDHKKSPHQHYEFARHLSYLREKGVLIVGSGNIVHNLMQVAWDKMHDPGFGYEWAIKTNNIVKHLIEQHRHHELVNYHLIDHEIMKSIPTPEHFLPLLYVLALQNENDHPEFFNDKTVMGSLTMTSLILSDHKILN